MSRFSQFRASRFGQSRFRTREFRGGVSSNPIAALFASGEQGAWYDPSDMSTLFQDAAGTTPVTAVGDPVGAVVDKQEA